MSRWDLPTEVEVCGQRFAIRSDFRAVLDALAVFSDPELTEQQQAAACLQILFPKWERLPDANAAFAAAMRFVNGGEPVPERSPVRPRLMDWQQDAALIAPAVDKVLGYSCRRCEYLHWWEFLGAFQSIGRGLFAEVVNIRAKRARGKKLDQQEQEFAREHDDLIRLRAAVSAEEEAEKQRLLALLDGNGGELPCQTVPSSSTQD